MHVVSGGFQPEALLFLITIETDELFHCVDRRFGIQCSMNAEFVFEHGAKVKTPPAEVLRENRLRLAVQMLTSTGLSLKEIASRCGFRDAVGLSQSFSARYGVSPREYVVRAATGQNGK